jgi:hypothetical protein
MRARHLLRLYPRAWRRRYGDEFLELVGDAPMRPQQVVNVISGAIDAWLSSEVQRAVESDRTRTGGIMRLQSLCNPRRTYTRKDALIGAAVMLASTLIMTITAARVGRAGDESLGEALMGFASPAAFALSMPFWLMKGQPWKAQVSIVGLVLAVLAGLLYASVRVNAG